MISAQTVIEKLIFQDFSHINALGIKFDLAIKVPEKKIFKGFLPYMGMVAILVM